MTHWKKLTDSDFLRGIDLVDTNTGRHLKPVVTIARVEGGKLKRGAKTQCKPVLTFVGKKKKMAAGATCCKALESMYGSDYEGWVGKRITLYPEITRDPDGGGKTFGIRIMNKPPAGNAPASEAAAFPDGPPVTIEAEFTQPVTPIPTQTAQVAAAPGDPRAEFEVDPQEDWQR